MSDPQEPALNRGRGGARPGAGRKPKSRIAEDLMATAQPVSGVSADVVNMVREAAIRAAAMEAAVHDLQRHVDTAIPSMLRGGFTEHTSELLDLSREGKRTAFLLIDALRRIEVEVGTANSRLGAIGDLLRESVAASEAERELGAKRHGDIMQAFRSVADDTRQAVANAERIAEEVTVMRRSSDRTATLLGSEIRPAVAGIQADLERIHGTVEVVEAAAPVSTLAAAARDGAREGAREGVAAARRSSARNPTEQPPAAAIQTITATPVPSVAAAPQRLPERTEGMMAPAPTPPRPASAPRSGFTPPRGFGFTPPRGFGPPVAMAPRPKPG